MGNTGGRDADNPLAVVARDATLDLVLTDVHLAFEDGEWQSNKAIEAALSGDTLTITDGGYVPEGFARGRINPCFIRSIVANRSKFSVRGPVVRVAADIRVRATQSNVVLRLADFDEHRNVQCDIREKSSLVLHGSIKEFALVAEGSSANLFVHCDTARVNAIASQITGSTTADYAFLTICDASRLKGVRVLKHVDLGETGAVVDMHVDPACTIENPPRWIPLATALARMTKTAESKEIDNSL